MPQAPSMYNMNRTSGSLSLSPMRRGSSFPLTTDQLTKVQGKESVLAAKYRAAGVEDGIYAPNWVVVKGRGGSWQPCADKLDVKLPLDVAQRNAKLNEEDVVVTIPTMQEVTVVCQGEVKIVLVERGTFLLGLDPVTVRHRIRMDMAEEDEVELDDLEVIYSEDEDEDEDEPRRVRWWAYGIDKNQVPKGAMTSMRAWRAFKPSTDVDSASEDDYEDFMDVDSDEDRDYEDARDYQDY